MTNESRFMRELRVRQSRLNTCRTATMRISESLDEDGEYHLEDPKVMALCNEDDDNDDSAAGTSYLQELSKQASRVTQRIQHQPLIHIETRDEDEDIDFIEEIAESISAQPSRLFCEELAREVERAAPPSNDPYKDELDELLDEALKDDDIESQNEASEESASVSGASSSSSSTASGNGDAEEDAQSLCSSIASDDLRLIMSESGLSASSYQVASFYAFPNGDPNTSSTNSRKHLHKKIVITQPFHPSTSKDDDASDTADDESRPQHNDDDEDDFEYEYFPEPSVLELLPGLTAALDAMAERFPCGSACAKDTTVAAARSVATATSLEAREGPPKETLVP